MLEGTADAHSAVCLHLFSDDPDAVAIYLRDQGIPIDTQVRRLRSKRDQQPEYPVLLFSADDLPFDLTVLPRDALRQAPLDRVDEKPMQRASLAQLEILLREEQDEDFEQRLVAALR